MMKKKQGYNARLDDSLGSKNGKKKQSMKDRRDESEGMEKSMGKRKFSGNKRSDQKEKENDRQAKARKAKAKSSYKVTSPNTEPKSAKKGSPAKMKKDSAMKMKKSPAKMNEGFDKLPKDVQDKITKKGSPAKKSQKSSPMNMSARRYDMKQAYNKDLSASSRLHYLENERHDKDSPMNMSRDLSYGGPVIDKEPGAMSHMGASKVLKHMKSSKHSPLNMIGGPGKAQGDTIRGFDKYKVGDMVSEDDFEAKFKLKGKNPKNYPQLSVQDYSEVKEDKKGKYVNKLND